MKKTVIIAMILLFAGAFANAQTLTGTTWSYTERVYGVDDVSEITAYFAFTSPTKVIWYFSTPSNFVFPVGFGTYDAKNGTITFSHTNPLNKKIVLYDDDNTIVFDFHIVNSQATMTCRIKKFTAYLFNGVTADIFNDGQPFKLNKEKYSLLPNSKLVETSWYYIYKETRKITVYFKSENEVLINGEMCPYVCLGNSVSIKAGDNLDENITGFYNSEGFDLCREGIARKKRDCVKLTRIEQ
ncbi:MAG: hypothetical protein LBP85_06125 [Prevotellaceae bacterium]|jgi:hypothetical protein|nr:hypothetical protein [Prevotellaceae bacterium]